jgi:KaiC/GvpD/RAD55 family RecA-like ATPase
MIIKTHVAPVNSRHNSSEDAGSVDLIPVLDADGTSINWLDRICDGGIHIPQDLTRGSGRTKRGHSVLMLLAGPPGTGKSTFALEFCARNVLAARNEGGDPFNAFYVSGEESAARLIDRTVSFRWFEGKPTSVENGLAFDFSDATSLEGVAELPKCSMVVMGRESNASGVNENEVFAELAKKWLEKGKILTQSFLHNQAPLNVLVLDSLNVLSSELGEDAQARTFDAIQKHITLPGKAGKNPMLVILVLDAAADGGTANYWEYVSDIVFRFGWEAKCGYAQRTLAITKMRGQSHAWGTQRLKIYPGPSGEASIARADNSPYLSTGGIFVFPSVHWHLSVLKKSVDLPKPIVKPYPFPASLDQLNKQISTHRDFQGLPATRCTALIGRRGGMKSHLAYCFLLEQSKTHHRNSLLVSFRDDISAAKTTLSQIAEHQTLAKKSEGSVVVDDLIQQDTLEIIEQEAGMISPEEFFHKIYVAVRRRRENGKPAQVVVVNGLDQLEARFPLIANDEMFVTALIEFLNLNGICSLIIAATGIDESSRSPGLYGLLPMADLVFRFDQFDHKCPPTGYKWGARDFPKNLCDAVKKGTEHIVRVETQRVPAGQIGGRVGYLYRQRNNKLAYAAK